jgi:ABC-2 type transport system permease protein
MAAMSLILSAVFGGTMGGSYSPTIVVVDEIQTVETSNIISDLQKDHAFNVKLMDYDAALDEVMGRNVIAAVVFDKSLDQGVTVIQLRDTVEGFQLSRILEDELSLLENIKTLDTQLSNILVNEKIVFNRDDLYLEVKNTFSDQWENKRPVKIESYLVASDNALTSNVSRHYMIGMTLFFVTYSLMFTVGDFLEDKRLHTLDRMMIAPISRRGILFSNLVSSMIVGVLQICFMVLTGKFLFHIDWGQNLLGVLGVGVLYIFVMTTLSLFVVSIVRTMAQLGAVSPIILTGMGMLGGCMWPLEIISSKLLLTLANFTPHKWALEAIEALASGNTFSYLPIFVLLGMGMIYLILGERVMYFKSLKDNQ